MANREKPRKNLTSIEKRDMLALRKVPKEVLIGYGDDYLEQEMLYDAMEFYKSAEHLEGLEHVKRKGVELGNVGALSWLDGYGMIRIEEADWRAAAESAERAGKLAYAELAFRKAGDEERADGISGQVGPDDGNPSGEQEAE